MILAKIDVTKIDKARIFVGQKGKYIDLALIETPNDQYGNDYMVVQSVSKEDRLAGVKGPILGNAKIIGQPRARQPEANVTTTMNPTAALEKPDDDIQF